jgi:SnoaL-like domain
MDAALQETVDYVGVRRLQNAYADVVSRRTWSELDELFLPEAEVVVDVGGEDAYVFTGPREFAGFVDTAVSRFEFFQFVILNTRVFLQHEGDPDAATARLYMSELRQDHAAGRWTLVYGIYHDHYRRIDGRWWFQSRHYSTLARTASDMDVFPFPAPEPF